MHTDIYPSNIEQKISNWQSWLTIAQPADLERLLSVGFAALERERLVILLRDLICRYPRTLHGAPVILDWRSPDDTDNILPYTTEQVGGMRLVGWLSPDASVLGQEPITPLTVRTNTISIVVAIFETDDGSSCEIHDDWWSELFAGINPGDSMLLSSRMLLALPDALEAARALRAGANGEIGPVHFLSADAQTWARAAGQTFFDDHAARAVFR